MKWDAVEREMVILGTQMERLSSTFMCLAKALRDERMGGTVNLYEGRERPAVTEEPKSDGAG